MAALQAEIEQRLADAEPQVEVLLAEVLGGGTLRVFIDHPDGVTLSLCERVSALLSDMRERYTLEVSSPGSERPLSKPDHFRRYIGRRARVRVQATRPPQAAGGSRGAAGRTRPGERRELQGERHEAQAQGERRELQGEHHEAQGERRELQGERREAQGERRGARAAGTPASRRSYTGELVGASDSEITLAADGGVIAIPYSEIRRCNLVEE